MTTVLVVADLPTATTHPLDIPELSEQEAGELYGAMLSDVCRAIQHSSADLLVNYPVDTYHDDPETLLRNHLHEALPDPDAARYEKQVGTTDAGRIGNALTHLLKQEGEQTVAVLEPTAPFVGREHLGQAAMSLRSSEVVLGPAADGRIYFAGFVEPIDFDDVLAAPALETLTDRAVDAGLDVDYLPMLPLVDNSVDLRTAVSLVRARRRAGRIVPERTAGLFDEWGLVIEDGELSRGSDNS